MKTNIFLKRCRKIRTTTISPNIFQICHAHSWIVSHVVLKLSGIIEFQVIVWETGAVPSS
jgi:hypothetical protein